MKLEIEMEQERLSYAEGDTEGPITKENFQAQASISEGISGRRTIDTSYDCTSCGGFVNSPKSAERAMALEEYPLTSDSVPVRPKQ